MENVTWENAGMPPIGTLLQLELEGYAQRLSGFFVGCAISEFVIVKIPASTHIFAIRTNLFKGKSMIVRYVAEGVVFGFASRLIEAISTPDRLMFITSPGTVSRHELRTEKRVSCLLPANIGMNGGDYRAVITNISKTGCLFCLYSAGNVSIPDDIAGHVTLVFFLPGVEKALTFTGLPRNIRRDEHKMSVGVQFLDLDRETRNLIVRYMDIFPDS